MRHFSVRARLLLSIIVLVGFVVVFFYLAGRYIVVQTVRQAENEILQIRLDIQRSVTRDLLRLHRLSGEIAAAVEDGEAGEGSEAAQYEPRGPEYEELMRHYGLNFLMLVRGGPDNAGFYRMAPGSSIEFRHQVPAPLLEYVDTAATLLGTNTEGNAACAGLVLMEGDMILTAVAPIPGDGPTNLLMIGRVMDDGSVHRQLSKWHSDYNLNVSVRARQRAIGNGAAAPGARPSDVLGSAYNYEGGGAWHVGRNSYESAVPLRDLRGNTVGVVSITLPSTFRSIANKLLDKLLIVVCAVGTVITLLAFYIFMRAVITPLTLMTDQVVSIVDAHGKGESRRLDWPRRDEFGKLADKVNFLLDRLEEDAREIRESERETQAILAAVPDTFCVFDKQGILRSFSRDHGAPNPISDRLEVGAGIERSGVSREMADTFRAILRSGGDDGASLDMILPGEQPEEDCHVECRIVALDDDHMLAVMRDITAAHLARLQMRELEGKLMQMQKHEALGHLVGGIAHDFNNLLSVMDACLNNFDDAERGERDEKREADFLALRQSTRQASELIRQLQVYAGISDISFDRVDLHALLDDNRAYFRAAVPHNIELELEQAAHLPDIVADSSQILQVISNLLRNATEAIGENPGVIRLETRLIRGVELRGEQYTLSRRPTADWYVALSVADNGGGIEAAQLRRILEPFFSTKGVGRGLGLATVSGILESHEALLSVSSLLGKGTTFHIYLPASSERGEPAKDALAADGSGAAADPERRLCVLLVEDDDRVRSILKLLLEHLKCEVLDAGQEAEARVLLQRHMSRIDFLLLDANIRGMDGVRVLQALRSRAPDLRTYLISGHTEANVRRAYAGIPYDGFVAKPFTRDDIVAMLTHIRSLMRG